MGEKKYKRLGLFYTAPKCIFRRNAVRLKSMKHAERKRPRAALLLLCFSFSLAEPRLRHDVPRTNACLCTLNGEW